jgi:nitrite reductase/ring-hydroxylating ferredoxin subunit
MNRNDFLQKISLGAAFALTVGCLGACSQDENMASPLPSGDVDFDVDLNDAANAALLTSGGYIIKNKVVIAKDTQGEYVAATQRCSHEGLYRVIYKNNEWYCPEHGAKYNLQGTGLNSDGRKGLTVYKTELNGTILRIFA